MAAVKSVSEGSDAGQATVPRSPSTKIGGSGVLVPEALTFTSWWDEDREEMTLGNGSSAGGGLRRRYVTVRYLVEARAFEVKMKNEDGVIKLPILKSLRTRDGNEIECWDLHIGMKLTMLGRSMTLMQADCRTVTWLENQAAKLRKLKEHLLSELRKYSTKPLDRALTYEQGRREPGGSNLRSSIIQIRRLCEALERFRPAVAAKCRESLFSGTF